MSRIGSAVKSLGHRPWFAAAARRLVWLDRWAQRRTKGRFAPVRSLGVDTLLLTTTGRKSGLPRSQPLLFVRDGDDYVVVGSNWGQQHHPAWTANLLAHPAAVVSHKGETVPVTAVLATGEDRDRLWRRLAEDWPAYHTYEQRAAGRDIRLFRLRRG